MNIECPECSNEISFLEAFNNAFCWGGSAIVFRCPKCNNTAYFSAIGKEIEVGFLGGSPTIDPIPNQKYKIHIKTKIEDQNMTIYYDNLTKNIPSSYSLSVGK